MAQRTVHQTLPLPTLAVLPTLPPSRTPSPTPTVSSTPTLTATATSTATLTATATFTPTATPTLSTRVLELHAVMPGVYVPPTLTPLPPHLTALPVPPNPLEPLPDATELPPPYNGWISFESDHPAVRYSVPWEPRLHEDASRGQYHRTENPRHTMSFAFEGAALRVRYVAARNMGVFQLFMDGVLLDQVDAYAPELAFPATRVYVVGQGYHILELRSAGNRHPQSEGHVLALDAIQVFNGGDTILIVPPAMPLTPAPAPQLAAGIELVSAPPTVQPTATPVAPSQVTVSVVIAYDENGNRAVDPAEGVSGISVRVVEIGTNRAIAQTFTDQSGFAQLQIVIAAQARVVVPYFGETWDVPLSRRGSSVRFTLLLAPGNQPGLIP